MSILDIAIRSDSITNNNDIADELVTEWSLDIGCNRANCEIIYRHEDYRLEQGWRQYIYIENLYSNIPGYGSQLFKAVLDYLDGNYPGIPIVLYDASTIQAKNSATSLWIISLLRRGELSYYSKFGFKPYPPDSKLTWIDNEAYATQCDQYSQIVKSLTSRQAVDTFHQYQHTYTWIDPIINILSGREDKLMIDELTEKLDISRWKIDEDEFDEFIKLAWGIDITNCIVDITYESAIPWVRH